MNLYAIIVHGCAVGVGLDEARARQDARLQLEKARIGEAHVMVREGRVVTISIEECKRICGAPTPPRWPLDGRMQA